MIIIEDGTGIANSNAYADVAEFKTYFKDRNVDVSAFGTTQITTSLIEGSNYGDLRWGDRYRGAPLSVGQGLEFPRRQLFNRYGHVIAGLPEDIKTASIIYSLEWLKGTLFPENLATAKDIKRELVKVGSIETETEFQGGATASTPLDFPLADRLCKQFIESRIGVVRA